VLCCLRVIRQVCVMYETLERERFRRFFAAWWEDHARRDRSNRTCCSTDCERQREVAHVAQPTAENREDDATGAVGEEDPWVVLAHRSVAEFVGGESWEQGEVATEVEADQRGEEVQRVLVSGHDGEEQEEDPLARINERRRHLKTYWRRLIRSVRDIYGGRLTYAANFDQYEFVGFWDELDLLAINAYFPLRGSYEPDLSRDELSTRLEAGWRGVLQRLDEFLKQRGIPRHRVLFSELGYVERANSTIEPWASTGFSVLPSNDGPRLVVWEDQPPDEAERALAIRGLFNANMALGGELLNGILYWKLSTIPAHREVEPFVLVIGDEGPEDPMLGELRRFTKKL